MSTNGSNELLTESNCRSRNSNIIDLTTNVDRDVVETTMVQITFVRCRAKTKTDKEDVIHEFFEKFPGFGVTLESMIGFDNHAAMKLDAVSGKVPSNVGVVDTNVGGDGGAARIGIGIDSICEQNIVIVDGSNGEK